MARIYIYIYGFPASAYALEAAVPATSTDAYPCRQMDDNPVGEKGLHGGLPHVEVGRVE